MHWSSKHSFWRFISCSQDLGTAECWGWSGLGLGPGCWGWAWLSGLGLGLGWTGTWAGPGCWGLAGAWLLGLVWPGAGLAWGWPESGARSGTWGAWPGPGAGLGLARAWPGLARTVPGLTQRPWWNLVWAWVRRGWKPKLGLAGLGLDLALGLTTNYNELRWISINYKQIPSKSIKFWQFLMICLHLLHKCDKLPRMTINYDQLRSITINYDQLRSITINYDQLRSIAIKYYPYFHCFWTISELNNELWHRFGQISNQNNIKIGAIDCNWLQSITINYDRLRSITINYDQLRSITINTGPGFHWILSDFRVSEWIAAHIWPN